MSLACESCGREDRPLTLSLVDQQWYCDRHYEQSVSETRIGMGEAVALVETELGGVEIEDDAGRARLVYLVKTAYTPTYETVGGVKRDKTQKQRQIEKAVMTEVIRFAFDHGGYGKGHLTPTSLQMELMDEAGLSQP